MKRQHITTVGFLAASAFAATAVLTAPRPTSPSHGGATATPQMRRRVISSSLITRNGERHGHPWQGMSVCDDMPTFG
jgi:hypothetical protein